MSHPTSANDVGAFLDDAAFLAQRKSRPVAKFHLGLDASAELRLKPSH